MTTAGTRSRTIRQMYIKERYRRHDEPVDRALLPVSVSEGAGGGESCCSESGVGTPDTCSSTTLGSDAYFTGGRIGKDGGEDGGSVQCVL